MKINGRDFQRYWYFFPIEQDVEKIGAQQLLMDKLNELLPSFATADRLVVD
jgi:hypothetical protein